MRKTLAALAAAGITASTLIALAPTASAAPQACARNTITTGAQGPGTVVNKSSSSTCNDLNITSTDDKTQYANDGYAGYYKSSSGWQQGSRGYIWLTDGTHSPWVVVLSDVRDGTPMSVGSAANGGDTVGIAH
jgi:hypothetical protein